MSVTPDFSFYVLAQRVHCEVSRWTKWTACSVTCGRGIQLRGRAILKQPMNDGLPCPTLRESRSCFIRNCSSKLLMNWQFLGAKNSHFQMNFICMRIRTHFHINGFALSLALKQGLRVTRKRPIAMFWSGFMVNAEVKSIQCGSAAKQPQVLMD